MPRLGYVFQEPRLLPWRTVRQNIELALRAADVPKSEHARIIAEHLSRLHIGDLADAWPLQISGGQRQRVAIGRALAIDPLFVLMDEPFSALDELTARALRAELLEVWQATGQTIIFVTHSIREAVYLADRIFIMTTNPGRLFETVEVDLPRPRSVEDSKLLELEASIVGSALHEWERAQAAALEARA
jgi:NitT/TauT family transport system ATP-binding protein